MRNGHTTLTAPIFSDTQIALLHAAASKAAEVRRYKQTNSDSVHCYQHKHKEVDAATLLDTVLLQPDLHSFLDALLDDGVNTAFRHRCQDGGVQIAFRPAGWSNHTDKDGWKGHFDHSACQFSLLVGVCLEAPE